MKVRVEYAPVLENEVVLRCPRLDQEMLRVLSLVRSGLQKLCVWDENREIILLSPDETLYCESVDEHTFLYTASAFYQTALTLAELEGRYGELGYLRVSKSAVIPAPHPQPEEPDWRPHRGLPGERGAAGGLPALRAPAAGAAGTIKRRSIMGEFIRFYSWGLSMKFHMAVYTLALVFFKAIFNALAGEGSVSSLTMLQMLLVSMAVAILESFLFPEGRELEPSALRVRTVWWGLLCNLGFVGGALALGWFSNVPLWGGIFLVLFLEWGLSAMWFGLHVALRRDTRSLNRKLSEYQKRGPES